MHVALLESALKLACESEDGEPASQSDLRRSISTAYYAAFHFVLGECADLLTCDEGGIGLNRAWRQVYRSIAHAAVKKACNRATDRTMSFPVEIRDFATLFVAWLESRHEADYDPEAQYVAADALAIIGEVETAISAYRTVDKKHRQAFAVLIACGRPLG